MAVSGDILNPLIEDPNYVQSSRDLVLDQFKDKENFTKLLDLFIEAEEDFQKLIVGIGAIRLLENAEGAWLDEIGSQLGVARLSQNDDSYKANILATTRSILNAVTRDNIVEILQDITADSEVTIYRGGNIVEISIFEGCFDNIQSMEAINRFFPVLTFLRIISRSRSTLIFDDPSTGFGNALDNDSNPSGSSFGGLVYTTEDDL